MLSVLVANLKGGCGKTTIATHLAAACARAGHLTVLADADRQRSSLKWLERRPDHLPRILPVDWTREISRLSRAPDRLIIDAPAAMRREQIEELVGMAHVVVLPVLPSVFDEGSTERFLIRLEELKAIRKNQKPVAVVANRLRPRTRAAVRLDQFLQRLGHRVHARVRDSQFYCETAARGLSLFDVKGPREAEFRKDWEPLLFYLGAETALESAPVPAIANIQGEAAAPGV